MATNIPRDLIPLSQAASIAKVCEKTFTMWIKAGEITEYRKGIKLGDGQDNRPILVSRSELTPQKLYECVAA